MKTETRKLNPWVVIIVVAQLFVLAGAALVVFLHKESVKLGSPQSFVDNTYFTQVEAERESDLLSKLSAVDDAWVKESNAALAETILANAETEEGRRKLAQQKEDERLLFLEKMAELAQQQQEMQEQLDNKAESEIAAMGGVNATKEDTVVLDSSDSNSVNQQVTVPSEREDTVEESATSAATESLEDETYFGQFKARYVCTCANCFKSGEWEGVSSGDCYIWADPDYIPSGITVTLDQGTTGSYVVQDAGGEVSGRSVVVFNPNHSEANGSMYLYPKITKKE